MAAVRIAEAARLAGVAQSTLHRAMMTGRLAYAKDSAGLRKIEVAELGRVFEIKRGKDDLFRSGNGAQPRNDARTERRKTTHSAETDALRALLDERERTIARLDDTLADLRHRLDLETAERRQLSERLHGLLTSSAPEKVTPPRNNFSAGEPKVSGDPTVSAPPGAYEQSSASEHWPRADAGLVIPRPPWWRRWFR
jgi:uncharacterized coiled-coil protein SlyX